MKGRMTHSGIVKTLVLKVALGVLNRRFPVPRTSHKARSDYDVIVEELRSEMRQVELPDPNNVSFPSMRSWLELMNDIKYRVLHEDVHAFLRWPSVIEPMFTTFMPYLVEELRFMQGLPNWAARWEPVLQESSIGSPIPFWKYPGSSGQLIHSAYSLAQYEHRTKLPVDQLDIIFEFGGGYGCLGKLIDKLGFQGKYVIYDFPLLSALQKFYLKAHALKNLTFECAQKSRTGICFVNSTDQLESILKHVSSDRSLFIATWSLSEVPLDLREKIARFACQFKQHLMSYQARFREVNNSQYFLDWQKRQPEKKWQSWKVKYHPNNLYLLGTSR